MATNVKNSYKQNIITTKRETTYDIVVGVGELIGISVHSNEGKVMYYFEPVKNQHKVTDEIFEAALKSMLVSNISGFEAIYMSFYVSKNREHLQNIAIKVFKEVWNEMYNTLVADDVFERRVSLENFNKTYDFFDEKK